MPRLNTCEGQECGQVLLRKEQMVKEGAVLHASGWLKYRFPSAL